MPYIFSDHFGKKPRFLLFSQENKSSAWFLVLRVCKTALEKGLQMQNSNPNHEQQWRVCTSSQQECPPFFLEKYKLEKSTN